MAVPASLETHRLRLRAYAPGDGAMYFAAGQKNRAHLQRYESGNSLLAAHDPEEAERIIAEICAAWEERRFFLWGAFERASGEFVAQIYVGVVNWELPELEFGYIADCDHEGQGYVSEASRAILGWAFAHLGAHRVSLGCSDTNLRSARVAERVGFRLEGHLRENHRGPDGAFSGELRYGILRDEFLAMKNGG